jgi:serine/threonine protein kinase
MARVLAQPQEVILQGRYRVTSKIGCGAFSKVYAVDDLNTARRLALKRLTVANKTEVDGALAEIEHLRKVEHFHVVRCHDFFVYHGKLCIVMELASGGDLHDLVRTQRTKSQPFAEHDVSAWFAQLCLGLNHVHESKVLHRDIKAKNVLVFPNKQVPGGLILKLGDFGLARAVVTSDGYMAQTACGTPYNMSPELMQNKEYSYASDVWSLGTVLYEMCTGEPPFQGKDMRALRQAIIREHAPVLPQCYSQRLNTIASGMMAKLWERRPTINQIITSSYIRMALRANAKAADEAKKPAPTCIKNNIAEATDKNGEHRPHPADVRSKPPPPGPRRVPKSTAEPRQQTNVRVPREVKSMTTRQREARAYAHRVREEFRAKLNPDYKRKPAPLTPALALAPAAAPVSTLAPAPAPAHIAQNNTPAADYHIVGATKKPAEASHVPVAYPFERKLEAYTPPLVAAAADKNISSDDDEDTDEDESENVQAFLASVRQVLKSDEDVPVDEPAEADLELHDLVADRALNGAATSKPKIIKAERWADVQPAPSEECGEPNLRPEPCTTLHNVIVGPGEEVPKEPLHTQLVLKLGHNRFCAAYFILQEAKSNRIEGRLLLVALNSIINHDRETRSVLDQLYDKGYRME